MTGFWVLSHFDSQFLLVHLSESLIYIAIALMLLFFEDRWAYMFGMVAPAAWLLLTVVTSAFGEPMRQMSRILLAEEPNYTPFALGVVVSMLSVAMIVVCAYRWKREFAGLGKGRSTFLVSVGIVTVYYGVMAVWFWRSTAVGAALRG
jgi:hypothetical protein